MCLCLCIVCFALFAPARVHACELCVPSCAPSVGALCLRAVSLYVVVC